MAFIRTPQNYSTQCTVAERQALLTAARVARFIRTHGHAASAVVDPVTRGIRIRAQDAEDFEFHLIDATLASARSFLKL